jgi:diadenosine tetraphosphate (Ap4A) HIT family hydrolase
MLQPSSKPWLNFHLSITEMFSLHPQLAKDCFVLEADDQFHLLLLNNPQVPWLVLVPHTTELELHKLNWDDQVNWLKKLNQVSRFVEAEFSPDKLNVASIGNMVPQMHWHIIGRYKDDFCFPKPVWGQANGQVYSEDKVKDIQQAWLSFS